MNENLFGEPVSPQKNKVAVKPLKKVFDASAIGLSYNAELEKRKSGSDLRNYLFYTNVSPGYAVTYKQYFHNRYKGERPPQFERNKTEGLVSKQAARKIKNAFQWLVIISQKKKVFSINEKKTFTFKINFITLTLSDKQKHSDQEIKKLMLEPFIKWMQYNHNVKSYIWKAEAQENGNIHFHITTNKFIHLMAVRMKWNSLQQIYGYTACQNKQNPIKEINSTDITAVINDSKVALYMLKYFSKSEPDKRAINGMLWNCSTNLKQSAMVIEETENDFEAMQSMFESNKFVKTLKKEFASLHIFTGKVLRYMPEFTREEFKKRIDKLKKEDYTSPNYTIESFFSEC